jgi:hypothetical protein
MQQVTSEVYEVVGMNTMIEKEMERGIEVE